MAVIHERTTSNGKRRYRVRIRRRGAPELSRTFATKTAAKKWATQIEADIESRRLLPRVEAGKHTLIEAIDRWTEEHLPDLSAGEQRNRASQLTWWKRQLAERTLADVTPQAITSARSTLKVKGATTNRYLAGLSAVLDVASREWEWLETNPVSRVRRKREGRGRVRFLSDDERVALLAACRDSWDSRLYPLVLLAIATGARQTELLNLRWKDVNRAEGRATLHDTKNRDRRRIYFQHEAASVLDEMARTPHISGFLFANPDGNNTFPRRAWKAAVAQAGVENFTFHDLRHTAASYLAMSGATLAEIAAFLGHRTLAMVQRYSHLAESHSEAVAGRMAKKYLS